LHHLSLLGKKWIYTKNHRRRDKIIGIGNSRD